ncbi:hypothetical protein GJ744_009415 [Endocarpon pusillum]|uniref:Uncharacterized protein n=1 Tax=Endocarpon pusillum TaxID=364733 RepID=A0A8H7E4H5_9EURO|nr:hypothetical protein GJ744_009415 [Endocarpon pusillum]
MLTSITEPLQPSHPSSLDLLIYSRSFCTMKATVICLLLLLQSKALIWFARSRAHIFSRRETRARKFLS